MIDGATGRINWTPANGQLGNQSVTVIVSDGVGGEALQTIKINVLATGVNTAPVISISPRAAAQVGRNYVGRVGATDNDGDLLSYSIVTGPTGLTITDDGRLNWTPTAAQVGSNALRVRADDGRGGRDERDFNIAVGSSIANQAPVLKPVSTALAILDKVFTENLFASDADGDAFAYQLVDGPTGLSLDSTNGTLRWQPVREQLGVHKVTVRALDPFGGLDEESFAIAVRGAGGPPAITSVPPTSAAMGQTYLYSVLASEVDGNPLTYSLSALPSGMTIDVTTGIVAWTPVASQIGPQSVILRVSDGVGGFTTQAFSILVTAGVPNQAPVTHTRPPLDAVAGTAFTYTLQATDAEGSNITYAVRSGPAGISINPASGLVSWTPTVADVGTAVFVLTATDAGGAAGVQSFLVSVHATNNLPTIVSTAPASVSQGGLFRYDVIATDKDHEPLTYELVNGPAGLTLDSLGRARWQTALDTPLGPRSATFIVRDGRGGSATQTISFNVVADTTPPRVAVIVMNGLLYPWSTEPARVKVTATDDVGVANITLTLDGKPVALAPDGTTTVYFSAPGNGKLRASAFDAAGNEGKGSGQVSMRSGGEDGLSSPPITTAITSVSKGDEVQGFVTIVGTAKSDDLTDYVLSYRKAIDRQTRIVAGGDGPRRSGNSPLRLRRLRQHYCHIRLFGHAVAVHR